MYATHPTRYTLLPWNVQIMKGFTQVTSILYAIIAGLCHEKGYCYATNEYFGKILNVQKRRVQFLLATLKRLGLVSVEITNEGLRTSRKIFMNFPKNWEFCSEKTDVRNLFKKEFKDGQDHARMGGQIDASKVLLSDNPNIALGKAIGEGSVHNRFSFWKEDSSLLDNRPIDWSKFRLENGKPLSQRMQLALGKYKDWDKSRLLANIEHYQKRCRAGYSPKDHEAFLQICITHDYAQESQNKQRNEEYARAVIEHNRIQDYSFLKTCVQIKKGKQWTKVSLNISPNQFDAALHAALH